MTEYLTTEELQQLTGFMRRGRQAEWLKAKGIPHQVDGARIIVSREHVRSWLEGRPVLARAGMNIGAIR